MTIIQPHRSLFIKKFLMLLFVILLGGGVWYVYEYNALVDARYREQDIKNNITELQVESAELKNSLYNLTEVKKLETLALEYGLILENRPGYLVLNSSQRWQSDSTR